MTVVAGFKGRQLLGAEPQPVGQILQAQALLTTGRGKPFAQLDKFRDRSAPVLCGHGRGRRFGQGQGLLMRCVASSMTSGPGDDQNPLLGTLPVGKAGGKTWAILDSNQ
ncbi:hypothetical protein [Cyanobium gracile]|uniref:hypothetical protein n=1 Tax=Cyanobium gracile TaxID=59930 RepID=UPI001FE1BCEC|nr:hypothetical protein [Cyanobium gracile]